MLIKPRKRSAVTAAVLLATLLAPYGTPYALTLQDAVNSIQSPPSASLPSVDNPRGNVGYILSELFWWSSDGTKNGKIKPQYLDYSGISTWTQSGSNAYLSDTTWSVGIGTMSPSDRLHVSWGNVRIDNGVSGVLNIWNGSGYYGGFGTVAGITNAGTSTDIGIRADSGRGIHFYTNGTNERVTINSSGNVGIGTNSPGINLAIQGSSSTQNGVGISLYNTNASNANKWFLGSGGWVVANDAFSIGDNSAYRLTILSNGNMGIGTTTPSHRLDISTGVAQSSTGGVQVTSTDGRQIKLYPSLSSGFFNNLTQSGDAGLIFTNGTQGSGGLTIAPWANATSGIRITGGGNVGIGMATPSYPLDVAGAGHFSGNLTVDGTINGALTTSLNAVNVSSWQFGANTGGGNYSFMGNVGIGTSAPVGKLDVIGRLNLADASGNSRTDFSFNTASGGLRIFNYDNSAIMLGTNNAERMRIDTNGNVGVGTTSPGAKLDVNGDVRAIHGTFTDGTPLIMSAPGANIAIDDAGQKRISWNDGAGNFNLRWGNYYSGTGISYIKGSSDSNGGAATMTLNTDNTDGSIFLGTAPIGVPGSPVSYTNSLTINSWNSSFGGSVGIGTASPSAKLDVAGGDILLSSNNSNLSFTDTAGSHPYIRMQNDNNLVLYTTSSGGANQAVWSVFARNAGNPQFNVSAAAGMTVAGNVGIGTASPSAKLTVAGDMGIGAGNAFYWNGYYNGGFKYAGNGFGAFIGQDNTNGGMSFWTAPNNASGAGAAATFTQRMAIDLNGNVGIGTATPSANLHVVGTSLLTRTNLDVPSRISGNAGYNRYVRFETAQSPRWDVGASNAAESGSNAGSNFYVNRFSDAGAYVDTPLTILRSNGYVGIGTTSPSSKLDVSGSSVGGNMGDRSLVAHLYANTGNGDNLEITNLRTSTGTTWQSAGFRIQQKVDSTWQGYMQFNGGNDHGISFGAGNSTASPGSIPERMRITNAGNVGIGTSTPAYTLDVAGTGHYSGNLTVDGTINGVLTASLNAANISAGQFGGNTGGGTFSFGGNVGIGTSTPAYTLDVAGTVRSSGELISTNVNQARFIYGNYGVIHRNDGTNYYTLITNSGDQYGTWNAFRPFYINLATGDTSLANNAVYAQNGGNVGIGTNAPTYKLDVRGDASINGVRVGLGAGWVNTNTVVGLGAGNSNTTGSSNVAIGYQALYSNTTPFGNTAIGAQALYANTSGISNTAIGRMAAYSNTTGNSNTALGNNTMYSNAGGSNNTAIGANAFNANVSGGMNTSLGTNALATNTTGNSNTAIGYGADVTDGTITNATAIGAGTKASASNTVILGNNASVGIGTSTPGDKLHVNGGGVYISDNSSKMWMGPSGGNNYIESGNGSWTGSANLYVGGYNNNVGTLLQTSFATTAFLNGNVGIGTNTPWAKLDVIGSAKVQQLQVTGYTGTDVVRIQPGDDNNPTYNAITLGNSAWTAYPFSVAKNGNTKVENADTSPYFLLRNTSSTTARYPQMVMENYTGGNGGHPAFEMKVARGTLAAPTAVQSGDILGSVAGWGHNGTTFDDGARMYFVAEGAYTSTSSPTAITFNTTPTGSTSFLERMRVTNDGSVGIGTSTPAYKLDVSGDIHTTGNYNLNSGNGIWWGTSSPTSVYANSSTLTFNIGNSTPINLYSSIFGPGQKNTNAQPGYDFGIKAGAPCSSCTDQNGGTLSLAGGVSTGLGTSQILFQTASAGATGTAQNAVSTKMAILGNGNVGIGTTTPSEKLEVNGNIKAVSFLYTSDRRLKDNIVGLTGSLQKITSLNGYSYDWKSTGNKDVGVIAQEVEKVYPELVHTDESTGFKSVEYANLVAPLIESVKELKSISDAQKRQIDEQNERISELKAILQSMKLHNR